MAWQHLIYLYCAFVALGGMTALSYKLAQMRGGRKRGKGKHHKGAGNGKGTEVT